MRAKSIVLILFMILALIACTSPADRFMKAYPHKCMRVNDQIAKDGSQTSRLEEFPCKISGEDLPAIAK